MISGFLITKKIIEGIQAGEFTLVGFYERRVRRIFPALFSTLFATLLLGAVLFDGGAFLKLGKSATFTTLFSSNIFFWTQTGYFDTPSSQNPLLHMWSLSVEEQFYLVLPLLLIVLHRFQRKHIKTTLLAIASLSFAGVAYQLTRDPSGAFYLTPGRIWELLVGSILALSGTGKLDHPFRNLLSAAGVLLILISTVFFSTDTPFPGFAALLPVLGSAFIIYAGSTGKSLVGTFLSTKPMVFIGKISYSLYLWHWPLLVFFKYYLIREMTWLELAVYFALIILVSTISWKWIETPFRSFKVIKRKHIFVLAGSAMAFCLAAGSAIIYMEGFPCRFENKVPDWANEGVWNYEWNTWRDCRTLEASELGESEPCQIGPGEQTPQYLLWGDSHAGTMYSALNLATEITGVEGSILWMSACPPLLGIDRDDSKIGSCMDFNDGVIEYLDTHPEIQTIFISARWNLSTTGSRYKTEDGDSVILVDLLGTTGTNAELVKTGLQRTIQALETLDRDVIIIASVPEIGYQVPSSILTAARTGRKVESIISPTAEELTIRNSEMNDILETVREEFPNVEVIEPAALLCGAEGCQVTDNNQPLYKDGNHLSTAGSRFIAPLFTPALEATESE